MRRNPITRRRFLGGAAASGAIVAIPDIAFASHIQEPTDPITAISIQLSEYTTGIPVVCGSVTSIKNLRIEGKVTFERSAAGNPSEHWTSRLEMHSQANKGANWYTLQPHQNVPPHGFNPFAALQSQQALIPDADYNVVWKVDGLESGQHFEVACAFTTAN